tara:strand:+ start:2015 stop:2191 length:177 start_codon:yes stop_codon:yes gene_type:complete
MLFGKNGKNILKDSITQQMNEFYLKKLIFKSSFGKSAKGSFTLLKFFYNFDLNFKVSK